MVNYLNSGLNESLKPGEDLKADNGRVKFSAMHDGNFLVYATVGGDPYCLWATNTHGRYDRLCVNNGNGELCAFTQKEGGDTLWKNDCWKNNDPPYTLRMQDDGDLVVSNNGGHVIWQTNSHVSPPPLEFSQIDFIHGGVGEAVYPQVRDERGSSVWWDPREESGTFWLLGVGQNKVVDFNTDTKKDHNGETVYIGANIGDGTVCTLGFNIVAGKPCWIDPFRQYQFIYKKDSKVKVTVRLAGWLTNGSVSYHGSVKI